MRIAVVIPAAGASSRYAAMGGVRHKLDEDLGDRPVLHRTVELFTAREEVIAIVVAGPHDDAALDAFRERHGPKLGFYGATICRGGAEHRWQSVAAGLAHVAADATHVAIHDAARPCTPPDLIDRVVEAGRSHPAVIPGVPIADTIKRTELAPEADAADPLDAILGGQCPANSDVSRVTETIDRAGLVAAQTPQCFERELLLRAYRQDSLESTDDAQLVARLGEPVLVVRGDPRNLKLTTPADLELARAILRVGPPRERPSHLKF